MSERPSRYALLVGASNFNDEEIEPLSAPEADVLELTKVLSDPHICGFRRDDIRYAINASLSETRSAVHWLFHGDYAGERHEDDLLILYYTGHGIPDVFDRELVYLVLNQTNHLKPSATGLESDWLRKEMRRSPSQRKLMILDCCYSGSAAPRGLDRAGMLTAQALELRNSSRPAMAAMS